MQNSIPAPANISIRTVDTDVLIIALGCMHLFDNGVNLWMETGIYSKNSLRYINVNQLYQTLGVKVCKALPALHAFTGCDYTASFSRKGKIKPLKILEKDTRLQDIFAGLGSAESLSVEEIEEIEKFVCQLYGQKRLSSVNEARFELFQKKYKVKATEEKLSFKNKLDGSYLPPCHRVLLEKIRRTKYITAMWQAAADAEPPAVNPDSSGWILIEELYRPLWFKGEALPKVVDVTYCEEDDDEDEGEENINEDGNCFRIHLLSCHTNNNIFTIFITMFISILLTL